VGRAAALEASAAVEGKILAAREVGPIGSRAMMAMKWGVQHHKKTKLLKTWDGC